MVEGVKYSFTASNGWELVEFNELIGFAGSIKNGIYKHQNGGNDFYMVRSPLGRERPVDYILVNSKANLPQLSADNATHASVYNQAGNEVGVVKNKLFLDTLLQAYDADKENVDGESYYIVGRFLLFSEHYPGFRFDITILNIDNNYYASFTREYAYTIVRIDNELGDFIRETIAWREIEAFEQYK